MKLFIILITLFVPSLANAIPWEATNLPSHHEFISFLQVGDESMRESLFTNRFFTDGRTVTTDVPSNAVFSIFTVNTQTRTSLDATNVMREGNTYRFTVNEGAPCCDFAFTLRPAGKHLSTPSTVPEPGTWVLFATGAAILVLWKKRQALKVS